MKSLLLLVLLGLSFSAFAHTCHISLYDPSNLPYLNFYSKKDRNCQAAATRCYETIRDLNLNPNSYKCYTVSMTDDPGPSPVPTTTLAPESTSADSEFRREVVVGETVMFQNQRYVVVDITTPGFLDLKPVGARDNKEIIPAVGRQYVAITRGCHREICTQDSVIDLTLSKYVSVAGIGYAGRFVTRTVVDVNSLHFEVAASNLARTSGCVRGRNGNICVGNVVQTQRYRYLKVAGIQPNGNVVLEHEDGSGQLQVNINPYEFIVTR